MELQEKCAIGDGVRAAQKRTEARVEGLPGALTKKGHPRED